MRETVAPSPTLDAHTVEGDAEEHVTCAAKNLPV